MDTATLVEAIHRDDFRLLAAHIGSMDPERVLVEAAEYNAVHVVNLVCCLYPHISTDRAQFTAVRSAAKAVSRRLLVAKSTFNVSQEDVLSILSPVVVFSLAVNPAWIQPPTIEVIHMNDVCSGTIRGHMEMDVQVWVPWNLNERPWLRCEQVRIDGVVCGDMTAAAVELMFAACTEGLSDAIWGICRLIL